MERKSPVRPARQRSPVRPSKRDGTDTVFTITKKPVLMMICLKVYDQSSRLFSSKLDGDSLYSEGEPEIASVGGS